MDAVMLDYSRVPLLMDGLFLKLFLPSVLSLARSPDTSLTLTNLPYKRRELEPFFCFPFFYILAAGKNEIALQSVF